MLVLGGGPIGVEMGQSFARLGSSVTIIETNNHLLPHDDPECTDLLASAMVGEGIQVLTGRKALRAEKSDHGAKRLVVADKYGQEAAFEGDEILLAVGRAPNSPSLGLAAAGVQTDKRGFITVDKRLRTSRKHIFALGDAKGFPMFTHMAEYEAGVVVPNALYGLPRKARYTVIPWCTCSDPEVARVGLTEQEAHEAGLDVAVYKVGFDAADRPVIDDKSAGLVKLVCRKKKLLGASVVGHRAGDILQQYVMAMANGLPVTGVSATIEVYPGYGELARRAANLYYKKAFFEGRLPRIMHRLRRLHGRVGPQR
ncbi:MAG: FAD-dependent oxidoreductase [Anaerolineaceae bacterium]|nr:FAD-dependent oxidoreductase [Anaerolineaceae bacterium]